MMIAQLHAYDNEKALKCKPSALLFGRGRAKKSIALQGSYNIGIHVKISKASAVARARGFDKAHALTKMLRKVQARDGDPHGCSR